MTSEKALKNAMFSVRHHVVVAIGEGLTGHTAEQGRQRSRLSFFGLFLFLQLQPALLRRQQPGAIPAFARAMGYTPSYGWSLLRGQADMTPEAFGRFVLAYGTDAAEQVMQMAGLRTENLPCSNGTQTLLTFPKG